MTIRLMVREEFPLFWPTFKSIIKAEETYAFSSSLTEAQAAQLWFDLPTETYVFMVDEQIAALFQLRVGA